MKNILLITAFGLFSIIQCMEEKDEQKDEKNLSCSYDQRLTKSVSSLNNPQLPLTSLSQFNTLSASQPIPANTCFIESTEHKDVDKTELASEYFLAVLLKYSCIDSAFIESIIARKKFPELRTKHTVSFNNNPFSSLTSDSYSKQLQVMIRTGDFFTKCPKENDREGALNTGISELISKMDNIDYLKRMEEFVYFAARNKITVDIYRMLALREKLIQMSIQTSNMILALDTILPEKNI